MSSGTQTWIATAQARLAELEARRQRCTAALTGGADARHVQATTGMIARIDAEVEHITKALMFAADESSVRDTGVDDELRTIERTADEEDRPTEHWDPDQVVGPGGKTMAEALAELRTQSRPPRQVTTTPRPPERHEDSEIVAYTPMARLRVALRNLPIDWSTNRQSTLVIGFLLVFTVTSVFLYILIN